MLHSKSNILKNGKYDLEIVDSYISTIVWERHFTDDERLHHGISSANLNKITRKQNLQANSRSACQFWHKREKEALFVKLHIPSLLQGGEIELILTLPCV